jgi:hypothetical protein
MGNNIQGKPDTGCHTLCIFHTTYEPDVRIRVMKNKGETSDATCWYIIYCNVCISKIKWWMKAVFGRK